MIFYTIHLIDNYIPSKLAYFLDSSTKPIDSEFQPIDELPLLHKLLCRSLLSTTLNLFIAGIHFSFFA